ncbi:MAG: hypothetical protein ACPGGK_08110, partial [Pikeienuella sp.]
PAAESLSLPAAGERGSKENRIALQQLSQPFFLFITKKTKNLSKQQLNNQTQRQNNQNTPKIQQQQTQITGINSINNKIQPIPTIHSYKSPDNFRTKTQTFQNIG